MANWMKEMRIVKQARLTRPEDTAAGQPPRTATEHCISTLRHLLQDLPRARPPPALLLRPRAG